jgi:hypothetical protein
LFLFYIVYHFIKNGLIFSVSMLANFCSQRLEEAKLNFLADITDSVVIKLVKHCKRLDLCHAVLLKHSQYFDL